MDTYLLPFMSFAIAASITPGPNNVLVTASGANYGYQRSLPHILGATFGFPLLILVLGAGFGEVFRAYPQLHLILKGAGASYLLYLAWRIATAGATGTAKATAKPLSFIEAALFQWLNPKAWLVALSTITTFTTLGGSLLVESAKLAALFPVITFSCISIWCLFGTAIGHWLSTPAQLRAFNFTMAALIVASIMLIIF